jgi:hypothetical protein
MGSCPPVERSPRLNMLHSAMLLQNKTGTILAIEARRPDSPGA